MDRILNTARQTFGIAQLHPIQRIVIEDILEAAEHTDTENDTCPNRIVLLPTGAGKTLCFLIPALLLNGPTLVIYPLLALMSDQERRMTKAHIPYAVFRGGQSDSEREQNFIRIKDGARIIIANPEVLQNAALVDRLASCSIVHIAVDEAHCVSEWGDSFRPAYLTLGTLIRHLASPAVSAFTATASPPVLDRIKEVLFQGQARIIQGAGDRPTISYHVQYVCAKDRALLHLAVTEQHPMIVFCSTRRHAEQVAVPLALYFGTDTVRFYHAGLEKPEKAAVEKWFLNGQNVILVTTCAFGMGIDVPGIRTCVHYDPPRSVESYMQESGRIARDGRPAKAFLLWNREDSIRFSPYPETAREYIIRHFAEAHTCRRRILLRALGTPDADSAVCQDSDGKGGCDVCCTQAAGHAMPDIQSAEDVLFALQILKNNTRMWNRKEAEYNLVKAFNRRDLKIFGMNVWEDKDTSAILTQLCDENRIQICSFPWKGKLCVISSHRQRRGPILIPELIYFLKKHLRLL